MSDYKKTNQKRETVREDLKDRLFAWYLDNSNGLLPKQECEDHKNVQNTIIYWFEPLIPNIDNLCLIEENIQGVWSMRVDKIPKVVRVFT